MNQDQNTARIFREQQSADHIRDDMKKSILERAKDSLGNAYEKGQDFVRDNGVLAGLHDAYRRIFEQGWFQKDVFDGRWHADNQAARGEGAHAWPGQEAGYDQRQAFYGLDKPQEPQQEQGSQEQARDRDRGDDLER